MFSGSFSTWFLIYGNPVQPRWKVCVSPPPLHWLFLLCNKSQEYRCLKTTFYVNFLVWGSKVKVIVNPNSLVEREHLFSNPDHMNINKFAFYLLPFLPLLSDARTWLSRILSLLLAGSMLRFPNKGTEGTVQDLKKQLNSFFATSFSIWWQMDQQRRVLAVFTTAAPALLLPWLSAPESIEGGSQADISYLASP